MKESKFVRTKIVVGYVLIAPIGPTAMIYVWRQTGALLEPDHSQQELRRRRGLVNQTLTISMRPKHTVRCWWPVMPATRIVTNANSGWYGSASIRSVCVRTTSRSRCVWTRSCG